MYCEKQIISISGLYYYFISASLLYLPICFYLKTLKIKRNNYYDIPYTIWNLILSLFSIWGIFSGINLFITYRNNSVLNLILDPSLLKSNFCNPSYYFLLSKIFELGDTILILLRGRNLRFIQYYHHLITLLYCWYSHQNNQYNSTNELFGIMNFFIHSIMYSWYFLSSINIRTSKLVKNLISILQTIQMFMGIQIVIIPIVYGNWFNLDKFNCLFAITMYGSYIYLFTKMVYNNLII